MLCYVTVYNVYKQLLKLRKTTYDMHVHHCVSAICLGIAHVRRGKFIVQASRASCPCRETRASSVSQTRNRLVGRQSSSICSQKTELAVPEVAAATPVRFWCYLPDCLVWRGAFWFLVGSVLFVLGSFAGLFTFLESRRWYNRLLILWPFAVASPMYTYGQICFVMQAHNNVKVSLRSGACGEAGQAPQQATAKKQGTVPGPEVTGPILMDLLLGKSASGRTRHNAGFWSRSGGIVLSGLESKKISWALVDYLGAIGMAIGTCLYNISCTTPAVLDLGWYICPVPFDPIKWLVVLPNIVAGLLFVLGSYASWAVHYQSWSLCVGKPRTLTFWSLAFFLVGSFGFFSGCLMMMHPICGDVSSRLITSWFGLFFGYALGSFCFLLGSYAIIIDLASL